MTWTCWRCRHENRFDGPFEPVEFEHLRCEQCGAHESIDPTEGYSDYERWLAGQQTLPGVPMFGVTTLSTPLGSNERI